MYGTLTGLACQWSVDGQMVVRERMHDEAGGYEWGEVFRYDRMGRLTKMWYDVRNPSGFSSTDPVEGTNLYDLRKTWNLGKVYERDNVVIKEYNQTAGTTAYSITDHYQVTAGPASMTWNDNGYLTARGADDFAWTALGQLAQADIDGGDTLDYTYDAFGRRVKTVNDSQVNRFVYHGWHMIGEWDDTADVWLWQEAPWNSGERMLEYIALDTSDVDDDTNTSEYRQYAVHEDFQDTVWGLSDTSTAIAERYNYTDPYGLSDSEDGAGSGLGEFATQVFHKKRLHGGFVELDSELYDFRNRWYIVSTGSWVSGDPLGGTDSFNLFQSFLQSPLTLEDYYGLRVGGLHENPQDPEPRYPAPPEDCNCPCYDKEKKSYPGWDEASKSISDACAAGTLEERLKGVSDPGVQQTMRDFCKKWNDKEYVFQGCQRCQSSNACAETNTGDDGKQRIRYCCLSDEINKDWEKKCGIGCADMMFHEVSHWMCQSAPGSKKNCGFEFYRKDKDGNLKLDNSGHANCGRALAGCLSGSQDDCTKASKCVTAYSRDR